MRAAPLALLALLLGTVAAPAAQGALPLPALPPQPSCHHDLPPPGPPPPPSPARPLGLATVYQVVRYVSAVAGAAAGYAASCLAHL